VALHDVADGVVSREQRLQAQGRLLVGERNLTQRLDALNTARPLAGDISQRLKAGIGGRA